MLNSFLTYASATEEDRSKCMCVLMVFIRGGKGGCLWSFPSVGIVSGGRVRVGLTRIGHGQHIGVVEITHVPFEFTVVTAYIRSFEIEEPFLGPRSLEQIGIVAFRVVR